MSTSDVLAQIVARLGVEVAHKLALRRSEGANDFLVTNLTHFWTSIGPLEMLFELAGGLEVGVAMSPEAAIDLVASEPPETK